MAHYVVTVAVADLLALPQFGAERLSQVLYGEQVMATEAAETYVKVRQQDGYEGWVQRTLISPGEEHHHTGRIRFLRTLRLRLPDPPYQLLYGSPLAGKVTRQGSFDCRLPSGKSLVLRETQCSPGRKLSVDEKRRLVVREARRFLGVPYLWGGLTSGGLDCSGLVQSVYKMTGSMLPRDTKDQIAVGQRISRNEVVAGDLLFFNRHVGIALAVDRIIHSSYSGGGVSINELRPGGTYPYREDLDRDFQTARRVIV